MAQTLVDYEGWTQATATIGSTVNQIGQLSALTFKETDLAPFTSLNEHITALNASLSSMKTYTTSDVTKMNQAAANKVRDDKQGAQQFYPVRPTSAPYDFGGDRHE